MPKKPNAEIRAALRDIADTLRDLTALLDEQADALHNAKSLKPRANNKSPKVTKGMARAIRALAWQGVASHDIAAQLGINPGRVNDALNNKY